MSKLILSNTINYRQSKGKIILQTSLGNDIDNYQIEELSQYEINSFADFGQVRWMGCKFKGQPTPKYNCHGFTFASRRTNIDKTSELRKILKEDNYIAVNDGDIMIGDIVLYVDNSGSGDVKHTGMVVRSDLYEVVPFILVLSKWGKYKEVIHPVHNCGYDNYILEYWRNNHGYVAGK